MKRLSGIAFTVLLALFSLTLSIFAVAYNAHDYHTFQQKNAIEEAAGKTQEELDRVNQDIVIYLQNGEPSRMTDHFGDRESAHMVDVYALFSLARIICLVSAAAMAGLFVARRHAERPQSDRVAWVAQAVVFLLLAALALFAIQSWQSVFTTFHHLFFRNDLWLLDPDTDLMIQMMPAPFFMGMARGIALRFVLLSLLGQGLWTVAGRRPLFKTKAKSKGEHHV